MDGSGFSVQRSVFGRRSVPSASLGAGYQFGMTGSALGRARLRQRHALDGGRDRKTNPIGRFDAGPTMVVGGNTPHPPISAKRSQFSGLSAKLDVIDLENVVLPSETKWHLASFCRKWLRSGGESMLGVGWAAKVWESRQRCPWTDFNICAASQCASCESRMALPATVSPPSRRTTAIFR